MAAAVDIAGQHDGLARLYLGGIKNPVVTNVAHRDAGRMIVERALPFLRLHSEIRDEDGRRGRIQSVWVAVEDCIPRLMLDVQYDDEPVVPTGPKGTVPFVVQSGRLAARRDPTVPWGQLPEGKIVIEPGRPIRRDGTQKWWGGAPDEKVVIEPTQERRRRSDSALSFETPKMVRLVTTAPAEAGTIPPERGPRKSQRGPMAGRFAMALRTLLAPPRRIAELVTLAAVRIHARLTCSGARPKKLNA